MPKFNNQDLQAHVEGYVNRIKYAQDNRKTRVWISNVISLKELYGDDAEDVKKLDALLIEIQGGKRRERRIINKKPVEEVNTEKRSVFSEPQRIDGDCPTCPKARKSVSSTNAANQTSPQEDKSEIATEQDAPKSFIEAESADEVLAYFREGVSDDTELFKRLVSAAEGIGVEISSKVKNPKTVARKIFDNINE